MDAAIAFFSTNLGFKVVTEMRNLPLDPGLKKLFQVRDSASVKRIVMMRAGNGANIELFQYETRKAQSRNLSPMTQELGTSACIQTI